MCWKNMVAQERLGSIREKHWTALSQHRQTNIVLETETQWDIQQRFIFYVDRWKKPTCCILARDYHHTIETVNSTNEHHTLDFVTNLLNWRNFRQCFSRNWLKYSIWRNNTSVDEKSFKFSKVTKLNDFFNWISNLIFTNHVFPYKILIILLFKFH